MKISKGNKRIKACDGIGCSPREKAARYIKCAMECLAKCPDDDICRDSIGNLSVVLVDIMPDDCYHKQDDFCDLDEVVSQ